MKAPRATALVWFLAVLVLTAAPDPACRAATEEKTVSDIASPSVLRIINVLVVNDAAALRQAIPPLKGFDLSGVKSLVSHGSGFVVGNGGWTITNHHVVQGQEDALAHFLEAVINKAAGRSVNLRDPQVQRELRPIAARLLEIKAMEVQIWAVSESGGTVYMRRARQQAVDEELDLALLQVEGLNSRPLALNVGDLRAGDGVCALGYPGVADDDVTGSPFVADPVTAWLRTDQPSVIRSPSTAMIRYARATYNASQVRRFGPHPWKESKRVAEPLVVEHDVNIGHGNSGGPLLNSVGEVVGINTLVYGRNPTDIIRLSLHASLIHAFLDQQKIAHVSVSKRQVGGAGLVPFPWLPVAAFASAVLLGLTALAVAWRRSRTVGAGYTTVMQWVAKARPNTPPPPPINPPLAVDPPLRFEPSRHRSPPPTPGRLDAEPADHPAPPPGPARSATGDGWQLSGTAEDGRPIVINLSGRDFARRRGRLVVGRSPELTHICVRHDSVSKRQAAFQRRAAKLFVEDLASANGTAVNGAELPPYEPRPLQPGDRMTLGELQLRLRQV